MSAVLKESPPDTVRAVHVAAAAKAAADAEVARLQARLALIESRAMATLADRARHQQAVTTALLEGDELPKARQPVVIEPDQALRVVREALKQAEAALTVATNAHRDAVVYLIQHRRSEALADYRQVFAAYVTAMRSLAAYDRILSRTGIPGALSPLFRSRLSIPSSGGLEDPQVSPGLAVDGRGFFNRPDLDEREREARSALEAEAGCGLPF